MSKTLKLKETSISIIDESNKKIENANYLDLLKLCINNPPQGGFIPVIMKERFRILDKIDETLMELKELPKDKKDLVSKIRDEIKDFETKLDLKRNELKEIIGLTELKLEDSDAEKAKDCVDKMQWGSLNRDIYKFIESVSSDLSTK